MAYYLPRMTTDSRIPEKKMARTPLSKIDLSISSLNAAAIVNHDTPGISRCHVPGRTIHASASECSIREVKTSVSLLLICPVALSVAFFQQLTQLQLMEANSSSYHHDLHLQVLGVHQVLSLGIVTRHPSGSKQVHL